MSETKMRTGYSLLSKRWSFWVKLGIEQGDEDDIDP